MNKNMKIAEYFTLKIDALQEELSDTESVILKIIIESQIKMLLHMKEEIVSVLMDTPTYILNAPYKARFGWYIGAVHPNGDDTSFYLHDDGNIKMGTSMIDGSSSGYYETKEQARECIDRYKG